MSKQWEKRRKRLYDIIEVGSDYDVYSRTYDFVNASAIILNIVASIMYTFKEWREQYGTTHKNLSIVPHQSLL